MASSLVFGADTYREGAWERLDDAGALWDAKSHVACMYLAGRAVESMFRALICLESRELDTGHDLRKLLKQAGSLGVLERPDRDTLNESLENVAGIWHNNLRFAGKQRVKRWLKERKKDRGVKGGFLERNCRSLLNACSRIVNRGDVAWRRCKTSSKKL